MPAPTRGPGARANARAQSSFVGLGRPQQVAAETRDLQGVAGQLTRWLRVSSRTAQVLATYIESHGAQALLDQLDESQEAQLRLLWPILQAADSVMDPPVELADLPVAPE